MCSSDDVMPDWSTILENRADNNKVKMQKLLRRNARSLELHKAGLSV